MAPAPDGVARQRGQVEVDTIVQLRDGPMSADLLDQLGLLIV